MKTKKFALALSSLLVAILIYVYTYFSTSRVIAVQASDGTHVTTRLMAQPWRCIYRPIGAIETALRPKGFGVAYETKLQ